MDTNYFQAAFLQWQQNHGISRTYELLTQAQRSEIMLLAQEIKAAEKKGVLSVEEVLARVERRSTKR